MTNTVAFYYHIKRLHYHQSEKLMQFVATTEYMYMLGYRKTDLILANIHVGNIVSSAYLTLIHFGKKSYS